MSDLKQLYVVGAGGFGREVIWLAETINESNETWDIKGFVDDNPSLWNKYLDGYKVFGGLDYLYDLNCEVWCVVAVGNSKIRDSIVNRLSENEKIRFATLIAPDAILGKNSVIEDGTIICSGTILTVDVTIGRHSIVNLNCTIGHDAVLKEFVTLYPGVHVSGCVTIGSDSEIGTGTQIIQGIKIGRGVIVGAGATVITDITDEVTAVGTPARVVKNHV